MYKRQLCEECKEEDHYSDQELSTIGFNAGDIAKGFTLYKPVGCSKCSDGYKGRVGIYEVMEMSDNIGHIILNNGNAMQISDVAQAEGMYTLRQSALHQAIAGITSLKEVTRVT